MLVNIGAICAYIALSGVGILLYFATSYQNPAGRLWKVIGVVIMIVTEVATTLFMIATAFIPSLWAYWRLFIVSVFTPFAVVYVFILVLFLLGAIDKLKREIDSTKNNKKPEAKAVYRPRALFSDAEISDAQTDKVDDKPSEAPYTN